MVLVVWVETQRGPEAHGLQPYRGLVVGLVVLVVLIPDGILPFGLTAFAAPNRLEGILEIPFHDEEVGSIVNLFACGRVSAVRADKLHFLCDALFPKD